MKILFLNSIREETWGGGEKWMLAAASGLRERRHEVAFAGRRGGHFLDRCGRAGFRTLPLAIGGEFSPGVFARLWRFLRRHETQIVIANFNKDVRLAAGPAKLCGCRVVARNGLPILRNNLRYRCTYRLMVDGIVTNTAAIRDRYLGYGWMDPDYIRVIHNGVHLPDPLPGPDPEVRRSLGIPPEAPVLGAFGRLVTQKQYDHGVLTAAACSRRHPDVRFLLAGDGPDRARIVECARTHGMEDRLVLTGFRDEVLPLLLQCDVVLMTSQSEGLPNVVLEAMAAARPVVGYDVGGMRELMEDGAGGFLVSPGELSQMIERVGELLARPELGVNLGSAGRKRVRERFSVDQMVRDLEGYLEELLQ